MRLSRRLPPELVLDIIHLTLDTIDPLDRSHLLYTTGLVSRTWHAISQPLLDSSPVLTRNNIEACLNPPGSPPDRDLGDVRYVSWVAGRVAPASELRRKGAQLSDEAEWVEDLSRRARRSALSLSSSTLISPCLKWAVSSPCLVSHGRGRPEDLRALIIFPSATPDLASFSINFFGRVGWRLDDIPNNSLPSLRHISSTDDTPSNNFFSRLATGATSLSFLSFTNSSVSLDTVIHILTTPAAQSLTTLRLAAAEGFSAPWGARRPAKLRTLFHHSAGLAQLETLEISADLLTKAPGVGEEDSFPATVRTLEIAPPFGRGQDVVELCVGAAGKLDGLSGLRRFVVRKVLGTEEREVLEAWCAAHGVVLETA